MGTSDTRCQGCGAPLAPNRAPGRARKWCSERCRKKHYGDPCVWCGARTTSGAEDRRRPAPRCAECRRRHDAQAAAARLQAAIELRAAGLTNRLIAERVGFASEFVVANAFKDARRAGVAIPAARVGRPPRQSQTPESDSP